MPVHAWAKQEYYIAPFFQQQMQITELSEQAYLKVLSSVSASPCYWGLGLPCCLSSSARFPRLAGHRRAGFPSLSKAVESSWLLRPVPLLGSSSCCLSTD